MKLITFNAGQGPRLGALVDNQVVVDLAEASAGSLPGDMRSFLESGAAGLEAASSTIQQARANEQTIPIDKVTIMAPVLNPSKIIGIGMNYMDHCREQNTEPPDSPILFAMFSSAIIGPGDSIRWDPILTNRVDFEAELAVVMGRQARRVTAAEALDYVAGYTICNDVSARDLQGRDSQWIRGKSLDTFCPIGPYLVTKDEIPNPNDLTIRCVVNGEVMQDSNTSEMIFDISFLIEFISQSLTLMPGDVIATGTPAGVGVFRNPRIFLKHGDHVTIEIERLGSLTNTCVEERDF